MDKRRRTRGYWLLLVLVSFPFLRFGGGGPTVGASHENSPPAQVEATPNTWQATVDGPPSARLEHTAIWTGGEMIVWGGWDWSKYFNTGGRYNPVTDT
jgi:hypothetical protein